MAPKHDDPTRHLTSASILISAAVLIGLIIATPLLLLQRFGEVGLQAGAVIMSGLLSLALVVLYVQQYKVLDRQTRWMRREFESAIALTTPMVAREDEVYMRLKNAWRGGITSIWLKSEIIEPEIPSLGLKPGFYLLRARETGETSLPGNAPLTLFKGKVKVNLVRDDKDEPRRMPFKFISSRLAAEGVERCTLRLTLLIHDEATGSEDEPQAFEIAEQELELAGVNEVELPTGDGRTETVASPASTTLADGIQAVYPQDIVAAGSPFTPDWWTGLPRQN